LIDGSGNGIGRGRPLCGARTSPACRGRPGDDAVEPPGAARRRTVAGNEIYIFARTYVRAPAGSINCLMRQWGNKLSSPAFPGGSRRARAGRARAASHRPATAKSTGRGRPRCAVRGQRPHVAVFIMCGQLRADCELAPSILCSSTYCTVQCWIELAADRRSIDPPCCCNRDTHASRAHVVMRLLLTTTAIARALAIYLAGMLGARSLDRSDPTIDGGRRGSFLSLH
jgi:hypothetical protein